MLTRQLCVVALLACLLPLHAKAASRLPNYSNPGPYEVVKGEYKLAASIDPLVTSEMKTELWAAVHRPKNRPTKPWPLVMLLHGNHSTCGIYEPALGIHLDIDNTYTYTGRCPKGYSAVKSHRGYDYLAAKLASWGYVVVSVNANRGVNAAPGVDEDQGLNLRRGRLILKHLAMLSRWNKNEKPTPPSLKFSLANTMDFSEVGLMGHSRGGEGMRAAWRLYRDDGSPFRSEIRSPLKIRSIFEIAPVDGQTFRTLNADGVSSMVLLPSCDGDVYTLEGVHVFDRMLLRSPENLSETAKRPSVRGTFTMLGGNHNFFNTEWQESDAFFCEGHPRFFPDYAGSVYQRVAAINSVIPFFIGTLGKQRQPASALQVFDPLIPLTGPLQAVGGLEKGFIHSNNMGGRLVLESFLSPTPDSHGIPHATNLVQVAHVNAPFEHDPNIRAAQIEWLNPGLFGGNPSIDIAVADASAPVNIASFHNLGLRLTTNCFNGSCDRGWFDTPTLDASVTLIDASGQESYPPVSLAASTQLRRPVGGYSFFGLHGLLQSAYFPIADFQGIDKSQVSKLRLTFDRTLSGRILLSEISLQNDPLKISKSAQSAMPAAAAAAAAAPVKESSTSQELRAWRDLGIGAQPLKRYAPEVNRIISVSRAAAAPVAGVVAMGPQQQLVKVVLYSSRPFPVTDSLPIVSVGNAKAVKVNHELSGRLAAVFIARDYDKQSNNAKLSVRIGAQPLWAFGAKPAN